MLHDDSTRPVGEIGFDSRLWDLIFVFKLFIVRPRDTESEMMTKRG